MKPISILNIFKALTISLLLLTVAYFLFQLPYFQPLRLKLLGKKTVADRVEQFEEKVLANLYPSFQKVGAAYPPESDVVLLYVKSKKELSLYARDSAGKYVLVKTYPVLAASGKPGPKLREGDYQVPEGIYGIESLNPNSAYHLALRVNYPNDDDRKRGREDGRGNLGSDIMIHGSKYSIGCLAMGDDAIEELFVLAAKSSYRKWKLIFSPVDFRLGEKPPPPRTPVSWLDERYQKISEAMQELPIK